MGLNDIIPLNSGPNGGHSRLPWCRASNHKTLITRLSLLARVQLPEM